MRNVYATDLQPGMITEDGSEVKEVRVDPQTRFVGVTWSNDYSVTHAPDRVFRVRPAKKEAR